MLKTRILTVLSGCFDPDGYPETGLRQEVRAGLPKRPGDHEWSAAMGELQRDGFITLTPDDVTGDPRVTLTAKGTKAVKNLK